MVRTWLAVAAFAILAGCSVETLENDCRDRIIELSKPKWPLTKEFIGALAKQDGSCSVTVEYDLNSSGNPYNLNSSAEEKPCEIFKRASMVALDASVFRPGEMQRKCQHTFNFEIKVHPPDNRLPRKNDDDT